MMRKFECSRNWLVEYRGVPVDIDTPSNLFELPLTETKKKMWRDHCFVYGSLEKTINGEYKIYYYDSMDYGLETFKVVQVRVDSIAQLVGHCYRDAYKACPKDGQQIETKIPTARVYENDIIEVPDWPGCLFEFQWSPLLGRHVLKLLYGNHGMPNYRGYKTPVSDCINPMWNKFFNWYPKENPRYFNHRTDIIWLDRFVFLGYYNGFDVWVETELGDVGDVRLVSENEQKILKYNQLPEEIVEKLKDRKLWD